jgi:signal transduction histidine kinase
MARVHPVSWLREHPAAADGVFAAVVASVSVVFHLTMHDVGAADPSVLGVLLSVGATAPLAWRRRSPAAVLLIVLAFQMVMEAINAEGPNWMGVLIAAYTLGAYRSGVLLRRLGTTTVVVVFAFVILGVWHGDAPWQALISAPATMVSALVLGDNVRRRRERAAELVERAERAERERALLAQQQVLDERARIARELHDVVAHNVSLMVIQTAAARRQIAGDPAKADAALAVVEETGRAAMQEMRRMLGLLRADQPGEALVPQPSLTSIDGLAAASADLPVSVRFSGEVGDVPAGLELSAYRIVQEALTNVRRHAGMVQKVEVSVVRENGSLTVEVDDDGRGAAAEHSGAEGFGIVGMRERVAAFGGRLHTGPRVGGGWRVRAVFPVPTE